MNSEISFIKAIALSLSFSESEKVLSILTSSSRLFFICPSKSTIEFSFSYNLEYVSEVSSKSFSEFSSIFNSSANFSSSPSSGETASISLIWNAYKSFFSLKMLLYPLGILIHSKQK